LKYQIIHPAKNTKPINKDGRDYVGSFVASVISVWWKLNNEKISIAARLHLTAFGVISVWWKLNQK